MWLTGVSSLHNFRRFLFHSDGEFSCMFWVDVERLKHTQDKRFLRRQVTRILELYLQDGAKFSLHEDVKAKLLLNEDRVDGSRPGMSQRVIKTLIRGQELIIARLKEYWCPRYKLHLEEISQNTHRRESSHQIFLHGVGHSSPPKYRLGASILSISELDKRKRRHKSQFYLPRIIHDKGKDGIDARPKRLTHIKTSSSKLPQFSGCLQTDSSLKSVSIGSRDDIHSFNSEVRALELLLSPSTLTLFPRSSESEVKSSGNAPSLVPESARLFPYLTASLRADFIAGNPFLRHLKNVMYNSKAVNYLLFWQSVECILTQDEARRWYRIFDPQKSNDQRCPYLSYVETYPVASDLKELLHLFVKDGAPHKIGLAADVRKELCVLLPKGLGQSLILSAQEEASEVSFSKIHSYC